MKRDNTHDVGTNSIAHCGTNNIIKNLKPANRDGMNNSSEMEMNSLRLSLSKHSASTLNAHLTTFCTVNLVEILKKHAIFQ